MAFCSVLSLLSSSCMMLGPDYSPPKPALEDNWLYSQDPQTTEQPQADPQWWALAFGDPTLNALVSAALDQNLTLRAAGLKVLQSQQQLAIAIGNQYPQQQSATGSASKERETANTFEEYSLGLGLNWEVDMWGRFRRLVESAAAELDASVAGYDDVLVSLTAQTARTYILILTFHERLNVARSNIQLQEESLRIARAKASAGESTELDADQAETLLNNTVASVASLEISLQQLKNSLAILLGLPPQDLSKLLGEPQPVPAAPADVAIGMPQDLIRRRPDIRIAERQLAAQSAQIGVAVTDLYPQFSIGGSIGSAAMDTGDIFDGDSKTWDFFGAFQWDLFNYGRLRNNVRLQDARFQQLLVDYLNTVLEAQADVENSIVAYLKSHDQLAAYARAASAAERAQKIAELQYESGNVTFNTVFNTLAANLQQQDQLAAARGSLATNLVEVYRALGGGWRVRNGADPADQLPESMKQEMRARTRAWGDRFN